VVSSSSPEEAEGDREGAEDLAAEAAPVLEKGICKYVYDVDICCVV